LEIVAPGHFVACERWRELPPPALVSTPGLGRRTSRGTEIPVLEVDEISLGYGSGSGLLSRLFGGPTPIVVKDVSFRVERGETFALVGESGSGKSTIARGISGLIPPLTGGLRFRGEPLSPSIRGRSTELRRQIQYIFQNPDASLNPRQTVGATVARPLQVFFDLPARTVRERVAASLHDVRLDAAYAQRYPDQLSGGERQRVAIARALACDPVLLLCDEILSALDVSVQANILDLLRQLRQERQLAMLFIAHDLAVVRALADRVGVLFRGSLFEIGSADEVFAPPFHPYTHSLLMAAPGQHRTVQRRVRAAPQAGPSAESRGCA
jgi:peptide/nickel transport system ATP-binding protein